MACGLDPTIDVPLKRMAPSVGGWKPESRWKTVVLPGAVGPDQADDLARPDAEAEAVHRGEPAEALGDAVHLQQHAVGHHATPPPQRHPIRPLGRNEMTRMRTSP